LILEMIVNIADINSLVMLTPSRDGNCGRFHRRGYSSAKSCAKVRNLRRNYAFEHRANFGFFILTRTRSSLNIGL
jgi:hypothetical protein